MMETHLMEWCLQLEALKFWPLDYCLVKHDGGIHEGNVVFVRTFGVPEYGVRLWDETLLETKNPDDLFLLSRVALNYELQEA